jgi:hypothetical protein
MLLFPTGVLSLDERNGVTDVITDVQLFSIENEEH